MEKEKDAQEVHETPEEEEETPEEEITVTTDEPEGEEEDIEDLRKRAEVSSQNFERAKKAEEKLKELEAQLSSNQVLSDDEEDDDDSELRREISEVKGKLVASEIKELYPEMKEAWSDFESYLQEDDNKGMPMKVAAKAFLAEKGLLTTKRKGLEKTRGGKGEPYSSSMSPDKLADIRQNDGRKYRDMVKKGQIKFS